MEQILKKWLVAPRQHPELMRHVLLLRKFEQVGDDLLPRYPDQLHDPYRMKDLGRVVERLIEARKQGEPIGIFADYDTDGTPGAALLVDGLRALGAETRVYIATRHEGYGLSEHGLASLIQAGAKVVMTVDLGITGKPYVPFVKSQGVDLIVTDHHLIQPELFPEGAYAVVNPKQADCQYPFKELAGGGVAWKIMAALIDCVGRDYPMWLAGRRPEALQKWLLDLAAISTICDMVPLLDENRLIAHFGLRVLAKQRRLGLAALLEVAGVDPQRLSAGTVGFQIGPRLNAPTRMAAASYHHPDLPGPQASLALGLLLARDREQALALAGELDEYNRRRQVELESVLAAAVDMVEKNHLAEHKVIIVAGRAWPVGIVGLVAGRLMERYGRPAIVFSLTGDEAVGSARSIDGFHLVDALHQAKHCLIKYGGHAKAAGLSVAADRLQLASEAILAYADQTLSADQLGPRLMIDAEVTDHEITLELAGQLEKLAPFGIGNPRPVFLLQNVFVNEARPVGKHGQHLKLRLRQAQGEHQHLAIGFHLAEAFERIRQEAGPIDIVFALEMNRWNGQEQPELHLIDLRPAER